MHLILGVLKALLRQYLKRELGYILFDRPKTWR